jgi:Tol biopolymer transport system component
MRKTLLITLSILVVVIYLAARLQASDPEEFGIFTSTLDGKNVKRLIADSREMNHARVSPDGKWITFTRYNKKGFGTPAVETNGYELTELMIMRIDGSDVRSLIPPKKNEFAANGYWTPDGKGILFIAKPPRGSTELRRYDVASAQMVPLKGPAGMWLTDPHQVGRNIVFPAQDPKAKKKNTIWMMDDDGRNVRQLTNPSPSDPYPVDFDPKLSPDGTKVAVMRQIGKDNWHIIIVDVSSGRERDLSSADAVDGVPEWSSDGRLLVFWHVNPKDLRSSGLYTITADGRQRTRIDLPRGFFYTMPAFFPGDGSNSNARIIFSARKNRAL